MKTLYQYAIVRFLPQAQTGEFANVGIVLCAPDQVVFEFRLAPARLARVTDFLKISTASYTKPPSTRCKPS